MRYVPGLQTQGIDGRRRKEEDASGIGGESRQRVLQEGELWGLQEPRAEAREGEAEGVGRKARRVLEASRSLSTGKHLNTKPSAPPSRFIEATQFTLQDYEIFKSGTAFDNKFRQAAMAKMVEEEKDKKSELNRLGIENVRRIRVLREASDTEGTNLRLVYETKVDRRDLERKAFQVEQDKAANLRYTFPLWIVDTKAHVKKVIEELVAWVDSKPVLQKEIASTLETINTVIEESKMESKVLMQARVDIYKLIHSYTSGQAIPKDLSEAAGWTAEQVARDWPPEKIASVTAENEIRSELFSLLDYLASVLRVIPATLFDKSSFLAYANSLRPPRPPQVQSKPNQKPRGDQKNRDKSPRRNPNTNGAVKHNPGPQA